MISRAPEPVEEMATDAAVRVVVLRALRVLDRSTAGSSAALVRRNGDDLLVGAHGITGLTEALSRSIETGERSVVGDTSSVHGLPLLTSEGKPFGALAAMADAPDQAVAEAMDDVAALLVQQLEMTSLRRRLGEEATARAESEQITALSRALLGSITVDEVVRNAVEHLGRIGIGNVVSVGLPDGSEDVLRLRHGGTRSDYLAAAWPELPVESAYPMAVSFRSGALIDVEGDSLATYPGLAEELVRLDATRYASAALRGTDDGIVGALGIAVPADQRMDRLLLARLASIVGDAVERTELLERSATTARILSTAIRPSRIDPVPGIEIGASFSLASDQAWVGGDWYDVLVGERHTGLVIGDVAGHDVGAARTAARLRFALAALFDERPSDPSWVMERLHRHAKRARTRRAATILLAVIEPETGHVVIASAAHPAPAHVRQGAASFVDLAPSPPVGTIDGASRIGHVRLEPGDRLVLFSDGIVERRTEPIDVGLDRLAERVSTHWGSVGSLARILADNTSGDDDASALVVERTNPP